ncbi:MAG TPA: hypothetical protein VEJ46_10790 [Candidatus Acidoferrum sp.]|nr:hypothetical protein [Candidatus Acidoferrum sp.]
MDCAALISDLLEKAIEKEEAELKVLTAAGTPQSVNSVTKYGESWLYVPILKEALARGAVCPELGWEEDHVDLQFIRDGNTVATFEFKPFFPVPPATFGKICRDFEKQRDADLADPAVEHYVVLIPYGSERAVAAWLDAKLLPTVRDSCNIVISDVRRAKPIKLNNGDDGQAFILVYRVKAAARAASAN